LNASSLSSSMILTGVIAPGPASPTPRRGIRRDAIFVTMSGNLPRDAHGCRAGPTIRGKPQKSGLCPAAPHLARRRAVP
jgi:hypothetical protein